MLVVTQDPILLPVDERDAVLELGRILHLGTPSVIGSKGERVVMSRTVYESLRIVVDLMVQGKSVTLFADDQAISTQRAADLLGMSRPFFIKLLEAGAMAHHRVGNHRRVYLRDAMAYARKRDEERELALDRLARKAFEAGLYDRNLMPVGADAD